MMQSHSSSTRRQFLVTAAAAAAASAGPAFAQAPAAAAPAQATGPFALDPLPYAPEALEPHIDAQTMTIHHGKHHATYVTKLNEALAAHADLQKKSLEQLIGGIPFLPEAIQKAVQNNGGGHWNHTFFWQSMGKPGDAGVGTPSGALAKAITDKFGSIEKFQTAFAEAATKRFGSGWAWLIVKNKSLAIVSTANQDNPWMQGIVPNTDIGTPLLGLDVWEHAYYLKYQNKRADYITAWWNVVNWNAVAERYAAATAVKPGKPETK